MHVRPVIIIVCPEKEKGPQLTIGGIMPNYSYTSQKVANFDWQNLFYTQHDEWRILIGQSILTKSGEF